MQSDFPIQSHCWARSSPSSRIFLRNISSSTDAYHSPQHKLHCCRTHACGTVYRLLYNRLYLQTTEAASENTCIWGLEIAAHCDCATQIHALTYLQLSGYSTLTCWTYRCLSFAAIFWNVSFCSAVSSRHFTEIAFVHSATCNAQHSHQTTLIKNHIVAVNIDNLQLLQSGVCTDVQEW